MKKTYISPSFVMVRLNPIKAILTVSPMSLDNNGANALGEGEILTKENNVSDVNVWDNEW